MGISSEAESKDLTGSKNAVLGQVWVGDSQQTICIPANLARIVSGKSSHITRKPTCMVEMRSQNNLPMGIVVNRTIITPKKSKCVPVVLMNTNSYNVWIRQPLLAADLVEVDHCPWDYQSSMSHDGDEVTVSFHPLPAPEVRKEILSSAINNSQDNVKPNETSERPKYGP